MTKLRLALLAWAVIALVVNVARGYVMDGFLDLALCLVLMFWRRSRRQPLRTARQRHREVI